MTLKPWMVLACLLASTPPAPGQSAVQWWNLEGGFGPSWGNSHGLLSSVGQTFVGVSASTTSRLVSGFLADARLRTVPLTAVEDAEEVPLTYELGQNYPNPFNPSTTIEYALPNAVKVRLAVYNLLGQEVAVLVDDVQDAGSYRVKLDASALSRASSGVYFYHLTAGEFSMAKKMVLIR